MAHGRLETPTHVIIGYFHSRVHIKLVSFVCAALGISAVVDLWNSCFHSYQKVESIEGMEVRERKEDIAIAI